MRVLVVEDDTRTREEIVRVLRGRGHHVTECGAAEPALSIHRTMPFPLILVDWVLPGMDGLELCRRLRELPGGDSPVIVIATSRERPEDLIAGLDAGADDYLVKPIEQASLTIRLAIAERTVLERARRELTEEALLSSEASFRALIEGSPDGIVAHRGGRIAYVNPALLTVLGYESPSELVGRSFIDLVNKDDVEDVRERINTMLASGEPCPAREIGLLARDKSIITMEEVAIPLEFDGYPAIAAVFRNVAERKHMEQQLIMADRMVSVGTLAAGIAHEINNPLAYVLSNLRFIAEELDQLGDTVAQQRLDGIRDLLAQADDGAERVRVIVRDLKSFSRAEDLGNATADVHRVLDGAISMAWNEIRHRAKLRKEYGTVPPVAGNEAKLGQVLLNLVINAAQSLNVGHADVNSITVRTREVDGHVRIDVEDTGPGISDEVMNRIFDPFFTTKPVGVGVGLGLSICHSIVTAIGGAIEVTTEVGKGSCFTVVLPRAHLVEAPRQRSLLPRSSMRAKGVRILVIDDEPSIARALQRSLRGHDVTIAMSGREALDNLTHAAAYDIVFCDLMMAEMSGMDLYDRVRANAPGLESRFVFMTGGAFTQRAKEFLGEVDNPVLEKPFDINEVQALVTGVAKASPSEGGLITIA